MTRASPERDLEDSAAVSDLVDAFYERVLQDPTLAPVFIDVAGIDLDDHLPRIKAFWRKMLFGEPGYGRNMVARHASIHARFRFERRHFDRWLALFHETVDSLFAGPGAERAKALATRIARNLARNLDEYTEYSEGTRREDGAEEPRTAGEG
jgi:hemoglobin